MAGKDRTGVAVALLHHLVEVHRDDALLGPEARESVVSVHSDFLLTAMSTITDRCGSIDAYLEGYLGVDNAHRDAHCKRLTADVVIRYRAAISMRRAWQARK